jgi:hypothetical protein
MAGLVPAIHVFLLLATKTWMPGTSLDKPGHDEGREPDSHGRCRREAW